MDVKHTLQTTPAVLAAILILVASCGDDDSGPVAGDSPATRETTKRPSTSDVGTAKSDAGDAVPVPTADYYLLDGELQEATFDVSEAPCVYVQLVGVDGPRLALFPAGSTYDKNSGVLSVPGTEAQEIRIDRGTFTGGGGSVDVENLRDQNATVELRGCDHAQGTHQVWGLEQL